jgi:hypothetical protein
MGKVGETPRGQKVSRAAEHSTPGPVWRSTPQRRRRTMNIFYIIGVVVVVLFVLGYFGLR